MDKRSSRFCTRPTKRDRNGSTSGFRFGDFALFLGVQGGDNAIPVHDFLHVRRRNEVTFLTVYFKKAKAFLSPFHYAFNARGLRVKLLFKLRQQRVILKHIVQ